MNAAERLNFALAQMLSVIATPRPNANAVDVFYVCKRIVDNESPERHGLWAKHAAIDLEATLAS